MFDNNDSKIEFNLSHHGDWTVFVAAETFKDGAVGVDIMKVEKPINDQTVEEFFRALKESFSDYEWSVIRSPNDEQRQLHLFYQYWCLKESYVKAIGLGLSQDLRTIEFHFSEKGREEIYDSKAINTRTQVFLENELQHQWRFEESYLDKDHCVALAYNRNENMSLLLTNDDASDPNHFEHLDIEKILKSAHVL